MNLKFACDSCGETIVTKWLKVGEVGVCKACDSQYVIPESAVETSEEPTYTQPKKKSDQTCAGLPSLAVDATQGVHMSPRPGETRLLLNRYKDGYRVATFIVRLGEMVKTAGVLLAALLAALSLSIPTFGGGGARIAAS
jgi:DNA-directed RNA polymerase subunit M/transcription elongation factor TFIIS